MKLLCDVCENAAASMVCCADEAALCTSCDSRIHAANKLAGKHQRMQVLSERSEPAVCDICQDQPSFLFCIEDRALLCRECDASIHLVNALAAKHRRFLLTGIQVGTSISSSASPEPTSAISLEHRPAMASSDGAPVMALKKPANKLQAATMAGRGAHCKGQCEAGDPSNRATKRPFKQAAASPREAGCGKDTNVGLCKATMNEFSSEKASTGAGAAPAKTLRSYTINKQGTLSLPSNTEDRMVHANSNGSSNSTTICIQRISAGRVPFVAPVLTSLRAALKQENASDSTISDFRRQEEASVKSTNILSTEGDTSNNMNSDNIYSNATMEVDDCPPASRDIVSDYLVSDVSGWRIDELLTDFMGVYDSGPSLTPPKGDNAPGSGIHEDVPWYTDLDFMAEQHSLSSSQEEGVALVPEMPSPPTSSGMVTSCSKGGTAQPWEFDYLFTDARDHPLEFSVVPDIDGGRRASPNKGVPPRRRGDVRKKRCRIRLDV